MITVLHAHTGTANESVINGLLHSVLLDGLIETLKILPFLFLTYLLMEFIEHKATEKSLSFLERSGAAGPAAGALIGAVPQCAFSAVAANLYTGRVITLGTMLAVFISTSDEMLPIMISGSVSAKAIAIIVAYKVVAALLVGFGVDITLRLMNKSKAQINIDEICENDNCHCERGIFYSALHHTLTVGVFILILMLLINTLVFFVGSERLGSIMDAIPVLSHFVAALVGLVPGCAVSVALTTLGVEGIISIGTMISGLCSSAGVGLLVLFRLNRRKKEIFAVMAILLLSGMLFGVVADLIGLSALL